MVTDHEHSCGVFGHTKQQVMREAPQIDPPQTIRPNRKGSRRLRCFVKTTLQFPVKLIRKLDRAGPLVMFHDGGDIGIKLRMENNPLQGRRDRIC